MSVYPSPKKFVRTTATAAVLTLSLALALALAACGGESDSTPSSTVQTAADGTVFNDADVQFATDMIPHHAQAVQMVAMTEGRTLDPAVRRLATAIRDAQVPEVETMSGWLKSWHQKVPATSMDHTNADQDMSGMSGMGSSAGPGMMSSADMDTLASAGDAEFQDMWLAMMIEHHTGAIEMARTEVADGRYADATALAADIISSQQAEIDTMKGLLGS